MTRDVFVTIDGLQTLVGEGEAPQPLSLSCTGTYYHKDGSHYVFYEERMEDTDRVMKNRLRLQPDLLELKKTGDCSVHMIFEANKKNEASYRMPYGSLALVIDTKHVCLRESDHHIHLSASYALGLNGEKLSDCEIHIDIRPKN